MKTIVDLHIHSRFARACSKSLNPENLAYWAQIKGVDVLGTGDFTHPAWLAELRERLEPAESGLFLLRKGFEPSERTVFPIENIDIYKTRFVLQSEVSCIYRKNDKTRRVHLLILAPSFEAVEKINSALTLRGCNIKADGRPILGMDAKEIVKIVLDADPSCMVIPAHAWTPWFAVFGSKSGFDSLQECFDEMTPHIYAIETGLSSDTLMNHQVASLDHITLLSNSDAHSAPNIAREANVMELANVSYGAICDVIKTRKNFLYTVEFFPEEGMYHIDGHRLCKFSCEPSETFKRKGICPVCKKELTIGVLNRVNSLASRKYGFVPSGAVACRRLVGLDDIICSALGVKGKKSKAVLSEYQNLIQNFGSELNILLESNLNEMNGQCEPRIIEGISRVRDGRVSISPGFDGQYGKVSVFSESESIRQESLL